MTLTVLLARKSTAPNARYQAFVIQGGKRGEDILANGIAYTDKPQAKAVVLWELKRKFGQEPQVEWKDAA